MKKLFLITLLLFFSTHLFAQYGGAYFNWVHQINVNPSGIALDKNKNVYTTGNFFGTVDFDPGPGVYNLTSALQTVFILKLDSNGNFVWAKALSAHLYNGANFSWGLATDGNNNVVVVGQFQGKVDFNPSTATADTFYMIGGGQFVLKLNAAGNFGWAKQFVGVSYLSTVRINGVATDTFNNVYTTGSFKDTVDFDPSTIGVYNLIATNSGNEDGFVSKLDSNGNFVWAKQIKKVSGLGNFDYSSIAVAPSANIYISGGFGGKVDFNPSPLPADTFYLNVDTPYLGTYVFKLNAAGNFGWAKQFVDTSIGGIFNNHIALDGAENVFTTGLFTGTMDFDPGAGVFNLKDTLSYISTYNNGNQEVFISKLDSNGNFGWAKQMNGNSTVGGESNANGIAVDKVGAVYTTGEFHGTVDFDPNGSVFNMTSSHNNGAGAFISKLDNGGNFVWAKAFVNLIGNDVAGGAITVDKRMNVYTLGEFQGTVDFDPNVGVYNLYSAAARYIHKLSPCYNTYHAFSATACDSFKLHGHKWVHSGVYNDTIANHIGCDSVTTVTLTLGHSTHDTLLQTICSNAPVWFHGHYLSVSGIYRDTLMNHTGCDSFRLLKLTVHAASYKIITASICANQTYTLPNGHSTHTAATYVDTLPNYLGCDSIITTTLSVFPVRYDTIHATICAAHSYTLPNGNVVSTACIYHDTLPTHFGCDSIITIYLSVVPNSTGTTIYDTTCITNWYNFYGININTAGTYTHLLQNYLGCDSLITLHLAVKNFNLSVSANGAFMIGSHADSYQWLYCPSLQPVIGAIHDTFNARTNGSYALAAIVNGCADTSGCIPVTSLGIEQIANNNGQLVVYPNPTNQSLVLSCKSLVNSIEVTNVVGQKMKAAITPLSTYDLRLDTDDYPSGIYFIKATDINGNVRNAKFVKE